LKKKIYRVMVLLYVVAMIISGYWFATSVNSPEMETFAEFVKTNYPQFIIGGIIGFVVFIQFRPALFKMLAFHSLAIETTFAYTLGSHLFDQYKTDVSNWILKSVSSNTWLYSFLCNVYPFVVQSYPIWLPLLVAFIVRLIVKRVIKTQKNTKEKNKLREIEELTAFHEKLNTYQLNPVYFLELLSGNKNKDEYFKMIQRLTCFSEELEKKCVSLTSRADELGLNLKYNVHER